MAATHCLQSAIDKCIKQLKGRASPKTVLQAKKAVLKYVCRDYCHMPPNELDHLRTKDELYAAAAAWVCVYHTLEQLHLILHQVELEEHGHSPEKNSEQGRKTRSATSAILGKDIMEAIWVDMKHTELPSWVTGVPHN